MIAFLNTLQRRLRPDLNDRPIAIRYLMMSDVVGVLYSIPLLVFGFLWLLSQTEWGFFLRQWPALLVILLLIIVFSRLRFFMMQELRSGHLVGSDGDFVGVILWASLLRFGPNVIWLFLLWILVELVLGWSRAINCDMRWDGARSACLNAAALLVPSLIALDLYRNLGRGIPISGLSLDSLLPALAAVLAYALTYFLVWLPFILYVVWVQESKFSLENSHSLFWFTVATMELPFISLPFGILASGLYVENGLLVVGIYLVGLLMLALLAHQLSRSGEQSRRHALQLMGLERLGRDILAAPPDARDLPGLLRRHIPNMFPCRRAVVWLAPETFLLKYPDGKGGYSSEILDWLLLQEGPEGFLENVPLPWPGSPDRHFALLTAPILDPIDGEPMGGIYIELLSLPQSWDRKTIQEHLPALQNLTAQIASTLKQAENYQETLQHQRVNQELRLAGDIQASFLPDRVPEVSGWDIAARLNPARQTSGDFYDFFMLEDNRLGIIIADVADKGLGAALYMALGRTLLLTYAHEYPENPAAVLQATNWRMLSDARAQMFITAFYGILDLETGRMIYCNAGHNPPLLIQENGRGCCQQLKPNGMALGIDENAAWVAISQRIALGDTLLLYTDGIVEAMNTRGEFYGIDRLTDTVRQIANRPSQWIIKAVRDSVEDFQGNIHQTDDITMVCLRRRE